MSKGPEQIRFEQAVDSAAPEGAMSAAFEWLRAAEALSTVALQLRERSGSAETISEQTGPRMREAFVRSAEAMDKRAEKLRRGGASLQDAAARIDTARSDRAKLKPLDDPGTWTGPSSPKTPEEVKARAEYDTAVDTYEKNRRFNEALARQHNEQMDSQNRETTRVMKSIHGEPDPVPQAAGPAGGGAARVPAGTPGGATTATGPTPGSFYSSPAAGAAPQTTASTASTASTGTTGDTQQGGTVGTPQGGGTPAAASGASAAPATSPAGSTGSTGGTLGGVAAATGGAVIGGAGGVLGGVRGAPLPVSSSSTGTNAARALGSSARTGAAGTLGRTTAATPATGTRPAAGASGAARAGSSTSRVATRASTRSTPGAAAGTAGGRAAPSTTGAPGAGRRAAFGGQVVAGRAGRTTGDDRTRPTDHLPGDQDWLDDEDVSPSVLD
ncbi:hypothetical protein [Nocardioides coralli]|uniref:hypothetical protein n=1 Tax=Nocardioides coralli TaxID=2872154 RepID=UPI001CA4540B|nr:hypothetical protein [Nocardioides coralli]QZY28558.1 hypothetical protein K6T13_13975 [Nocardioides coralli]